MIADRAREATAGSTAPARRYADGDAMVDADPTRPPATGTPKAPVRKERALASKTIAAVAVAFLLIAFGVSNDNRVPVDYLVITRDSPLILVIGVSALLGAIIGALVMRRRSR